MGYYDDRPAHIACVCTVRCEKVKKFHNHFEEKQLKREFFHGHLIFFYEQF
jgi:hypothetical protein